jgi:hypothetical protein
MGRIRTVKPEFFLHEELFDAEAESGLPLRVAFIGLWTQADREGRFEWRPRRLKAAVLPYDEVDMARVLHALATRGFIAQYACDGREFGVIPSFPRHQVINNRESDSDIPAPPETLEKPPVLTRAPRVADACPTRTVHAQAEGKGKEGKGREGGGRSARTWEGKTISLAQADYDRWRKTYSNIPDFDAALESADDYYSENPPKGGKWFFPVSRWLEREHQKHAPEEVYGENSW